MAKGIQNNIEDIFEETDRAAVKKSAGAAAVRPPSPVKPIRTQPVSRPAQTVPPAPSSEGSNSFFGNKRFMMSGIALIIVLVAAGGIIAWRAGLFTASNANLSTGNTNTSAAANRNTAPVVVNTASVNTGPVDSDADGLTDAEEKTLGTDPRKADTDGDGLYDREEAKVYKTNPLKKDTDGDGIDDGTEVKNGYNPAGPGKLYDLTNALSNTNQ